MKIRLNRVHIISLWKAETVGRKRRVTVHGLGAHYDVTSQRAPGWENKKNTTEVETIK